jgi:DNA-binding GntR family transcriptional regulator
LELKKKSVNTKTSKNKKVTVFEDLRRRIINGELQAGTPIDEALFAHELGVSKTPLREALRQLESIGLVDNIPGRGSMISHITANDILEIFAIREIIECGAAKKLAQLGDKEGLQRKLQQSEFVHAKEENRSEQACEWDFCTDIHVMIVEMLSNRKLSILYREIQDHIERIRNHFGKRVTQSRLLEITNEHQDIINALLKEDGQGAEQAMGKHLQSASRYLIGQL